MTTTLIINKFVLPVTADSIAAHAADVYPNDCHLCGPRLADQDGDCPNPNCPLKSTPISEE